MPRKSRTGLDPESATFGHAGQVEQHRESGGAFDQCADRGAAKADDEVAFPVSRNRSVLGLGGPLADHDVGAYKRLAATTAASPRHAQRPPGAQAGRQLAAHRAARRVHDHAPCGRWQTSTFLAALRVTGLTAPGVFDGAIDGESVRLHRTDPGADPAAPRPFQAH